MNLTIFAAGSRGDVQPCVALGKGLRQAGYGVCLAAPENFAPFVREHGLRFHPLRGDVQAIMAGDEARAFMESSGRNPLRAVRAMRALLAPVVMTMAQDALDACRDARGLICLGVFSAFGQAITEALDIPLMHVEPTPLLPTRAFPAPSWPIQRNLGRLHNVLSGLLMFQAPLLWVRPFVNAFRQNLGLPPRGAIHTYRVYKSTPLLGAYSPTLIPHPPDWPDNVHVTGALFLDDAGDWQPPQPLADFLQAGKPPVYVGFGSMGGEDPQRLADIVLGALAQSGERGLLLTGWGGLHARTTPENVFVLDAAPHRWLFPRMAAVVHHGGAGTTAEGLRAGVPNVVVPFILDQPFWSARIRALGLGPDPIPHKELTAGRLARAIYTAVTGAGMRQRAGACGAAVRAERGVENAVEVIRTYFGEPQRA